MSSTVKIYLIRHGQASFGAENYDQLSSLGKQQAQALGDYFVEHQQNFDLIVHGNMWRQDETAKLMANAMQKPISFKIESAADEFNSDQLLAHYLPIVASGSDQLSKMISSERPWYQNPEHFEQIFFALIDCWQKDGDCPFESWENFNQRVLGLLHQLSLTGHKKIALVTSGGFIAASLKFILGYDNQKFKEICLTINNASLTEITLKNSQQSSVANDLIASLIGFNNIAPLKAKKQSALITRK